MADSEIPLPRSAVAAPDTDVGPGVDRAVGAYDIRVAAPQYGQVMGAVGGFVVTAVVLVFTVAPAESHTHPTALGFATGLLVLGLCGSLATAFGLIAIGAERELTANLVPAAVFAGVGAVISITAILAAFDVLASIYLPSSKILFGSITGSVGIAGVIFISLGVGDAWAAGPIDDRAWRETQWLSTMAKAYRAAKQLAAGGTAVVSVAIVLYWAGVHANPRTSETHWLIGVGIVVAVGSALVGVMRTMHPLDGVQRGIRRVEAFAAVAVVSAYLTALILFLP